MAYVVTDGSSQKTFTYLIDANNFLNANSDWYFVNASATTWQTMKGKEYAFSGVESLDIEHKAGRDVDVTVYLSDGTKTPCSTTQLDDDTIRVEWVGAKTGRAVVMAGFEQ